MSFSNVVTQQVSPKKLNVNEFVPLAGCDVPASFQIDNNDSTILKCVSAGLWHFVIQIQLLGLSTVAAKQAELDGFVAKNGAPLAGSDATSSIILTNDVNVLTICYVAQLVQGDYIQVGIRSSANGSGVPNVVASCFMGHGKGADNQGVFAPSVILTVNQITSGTFLQTGAYNTITNSNSRVVFDSSLNAAGSNITVNGDGNIVIPSTGVYYMCSQYQIVGLQNNSSDLAAAEVDGWFQVNGVQVDNSMASQCATQVGQTNVLPIAVTLSLNQGDVVSVYAKVGSKVAVEGFMSGTGVYAPSVIFTAFKVNSASYITVGSSVNLTVANQRTVIDFASNPLQIKKTGTNNSSGISVTSDGQNGSYLTVNSNGNYFFASQYQLLGARNLNPMEDGSQGQLDGWFEVYDGSNWAPISNSDAANNVHYTNEWNVLYISGVVPVANYSTFRIRFCANSNNNNTAPRGTGVAVLSISAKTEIPAAPSVILTGFKI